MTLYEYNQLDELEQLKNLWKEGVFRNYRIDLPFKYIELKYHTEDNYLQGLRTFSSTNQLEPYLKNIKIRFKGLGG